MIYIRYINHIMTHTLPDFVFHGCNLAPIFTDLEWYTSHHKQGRHKAAHHQGTLVDHSVWTADTVKDWLRTKDRRAKGIQHAQLAIFLALFHDIGKAGDGKRVDTKPLHPHVGLEYVLNQKQFIRMAPPDRAGPTKLSTYLGVCPTITRDVIALLGVVSEMHYGFGDIMTKKDNTKGWADHFVNACKQTDLWNQLSDAALVEMTHIVLTISMADVVGAWPVMTPRYSVETDRPWKKHGYESRWLLIHGNVVRAVKRRLARRFI